MKQKITVLIAALIAAMVFGSVGVYADTGVDAGVLQKAVERIELPAGELNEELVADALEAEGVNARAPEFAYASDSSSLEAALLNPNVGIIVVLGNFQMDHQMTIDRELTFIGMTGSVITSPATARAYHFVVKSEDELELVFSNVTLDGGGVSGGVFIDETPTHIKGVIVENCYNNNGGISTVPRETISFDYDIVLEDCVITGNVAMNAGGGVNVFLANLYITNCQINGNSANIAGGVLSAGPVYVENSQINNNTATQNSGGLQALKKAVITNSEISGNTAGLWGGGITAANLTLRDSDVMNNQAMGGGGIYVINGGNMSPDSTIENTNISFNTAGAAGGGGIYNMANSLLVRGCTLEGNTASFGGAVLSDSLNNTNFLSGTVFKDNHAVQGGGAIYARSKLERIYVSEDSMFSGNTADTGYYMTDPADIAIHERQIKTSHFSEPFTEYAYNNYDISYEKGTPLFTVTASFYQRTSDTIPYMEVALFPGQALGNKLPAGPSLPGWTFVSWTDLDGSYYDEDSVIEEDVNLYPVYVLN